MSSQLITAVQSAFPKCDVNVSSFLVSALNPHANAAAVENAAAEILPKLQALDPAKDKTRYKFEVGTAREVALKVIFDRSFKSAPDRICQAAEASEKATYYPRWRTVCWVDVPKSIASVINHPYVKIALTVCALYYSYVACAAAYEATVAFVASSLPFIINNTPIAVIRAGNAVLDLKQYVINNGFRILFYTWIGQQIILRACPEIPHVTPLARRISIWTMFQAIYHSPARIGSFLLENAIKAAYFTWNACGDAASELRGRAERANDERLAVCKAKTYAVWKQIVVSQAPNAV